jgi:hypothetical protein
VNCIAILYFTGMPKDMNKNKTKPTAVSVADFLKKKTKGQQLADCQELVKLFKGLTGKPAKMWGPSIVGFGSYHYVYESGREGDAPLLGFAPRGTGLVVYSMCEGSTQKALLKKLGKHTSSVSCIYIKKLDDIDRDVLAKIAKASMEETKARYP